MTLYRLPFDDDGKWQLWNGNWDDPVAGHGGGQAYAYDFVHVTSNNVGDEGENVRASRAGTVILAVGDRSCNTFGITDKTDPCFDQRGEGNVVLVRHVDGTVASYCHLQQGKVFVKQGAWVAQGDVIGLTGNTGNSSTPHLHTDLHAWWNSEDDLGPTVPIVYERKGGSPWRPRSGDALPSNNTVRRQDGWRWCKNCQGLFYRGDGSATTVCPAGGGHDASLGGNYALWVGATDGTAGQTGWRWCSKCSGLFFGENPGSQCPAGDEHAPGGSYAVAHGPNAQGQSGWHWCSDCQGMYFGDGTGSVCPAGGGHAPQQGGYAIPIVGDATHRSGFRRCSKCEALVSGMGTVGPCPDGGNHAPATTSNFTLLTDHATAPGHQAGWRLCNKCETLFFEPNGGSTCAGGGTHTAAGPSYTLLHVIPAYQDEWNHCVQCRGLFFGAKGSRCPTGGEHSNASTDNYALWHNPVHANGQGDWRWCDKCHGLFFGGNAPSVCPAGDTHSSAQSGNYVIPGSLSGVAHDPYWRWCHKCQALFRTGEDDSTCPAGERHDAGKSGTYALSVSRWPAQENWRWCDKCQCLFFGGNTASSCCPEGGNHRGNSSGNYCVLISEALGGGSGPVDALWDDVVA